MPYKDKNKQIENARKWRLNNKEKSIQSTLNYRKNNEKQFKEYRNKYEKLPWVKAYKRIWRRCNDKNHSSFKNYGAKGIKCLITQEDLKYLWFRDNAFNLNKPSIDRIDNNGNYEISNCRFIELSENIKKNHIERKRSGKKIS